MASIQFRASERHVRFTLTLPKSSDDEFQWTPARKKRRKPEQVLEAWEQACRQRWRALALCIKAKLEAVECGEFEDEFLAHIVMPGGETLGRLMKPQIEEAYLTGEPPPGIAALLPHYEGEEEFDE
jgi:hypothetical protein